MQVQETEIALAEAAFEKEKVRLEALWQQRKDEYSAAVETQVGCLLTACNNGQPLSNWLPIQKCGSASLWRPRQE